MTKEREAEIRARHERARPIMERGQVPSFSSQIIFNDRQDLLAEIDRLRAVLHDIYWHDTVTRQIEAIVGRALEQK